MLVKLPSRTFRTQMKWLAEFDWKTITVVEAGECGEKLSH